MQADQGKVPTPIYSRRRAGIGAQGRAIRAAPRTWDDRHVTWTPDNRCSRQISSWARQVRALGVFSSRVTLLIWLNSNSNPLILDCCSFETTLFDRTGEVQRN